MSAPDVNPTRLAAGGPTGERRLRVLVVDDHEVVHWGLRLMLGEQPWVERCLSARTADEALALTRRYVPHVALVDLFVGQESGAEICERLREVSPQTNVLMISGAGRISPNAARAAGAAGLHLQGLAGGRHRRRGADGRPRHDGVQAARGARRPAAVRPRARGARGCRVGRDEPRDRRATLFLSPHTVKEHTSSLYRKLGVRNRAEAVQKAQRLGLIS